MESDHIVPAGAPTEINIRDLCYDRLEVHVYGEVASRDECMTPEAVWRFLGPAATGCNEFLYSCRVAGRDPAIRGVFWHRSFDERSNYFSNPYTVTWYDDADGQPLRDDKGELMHAATASVRSPERKPVALTSVEQSLRLGVKPKLTASLLVNAQERLTADQLREAVIDLGSACEIAATQYVERKGMSGDRQVKELQRPRKDRSFAFRHYHLVTMHIDRRSLKADDAAAFDLLEKAYKTWNKLAHAGELAYEEAGRIVPVTRPTANEFFEGCKRAVEWIEKL